MTPSKLLHASAVVHFVVCWPVYSIFYVAIATVLTPAASEVNHGDLWLPFG
jgi:hypothetical protein